MNRRGFLAGFGLLAAPAIIRTPGLLMPVRRFGLYVTASSAWEVSPIFGPLDGVEPNEASLEHLVVEIRRARASCPPGSFPVLMPGPRFKIVSSLRLTGNGLVAS